MTLGRRPSDRAGQWVGRLIFTLGNVAPLVWGVLIMIAIIGGYYVLRVQPLEDRAAQLRRDAAALHRLPTLEQVAGEDPAGQLAAFYAGFPAVEEVPDAMETIFEALQAEGVTQDQGSFRLERKSNDRVARYEISLPVKGTYPQLRRFLAKVTAALPTLAVDDVQFARLQAGDALVECRLSLTLYLVDRAVSK